MKIGILGAGFTGLTAALRLLQQDHEVIIFDKEEVVGGLAAGFSLPEWNWTIEKAYHHWFTNDDAVLNLARELDYPVIIKRPVTNVFVQGKILPFDSASSLLKFPYFSFLDKVRTGITLATLKLINNYHYLDNQLAMPAIRQSMGENSTKLIWEPLFSGKFGTYKEDIALTWFWARIKKRTPSLAYPEKGFQNFAQRVAQEIEKLGGNFLLKTEILSLESKDNQVIVKTAKKTFSFDKVLTTLPSPIFAKITQDLNRDYVNKISQIKYLHALNLILVLKKSFMDGYWLNITDPSFPFLVLAEHTNFMEPIHYNNEHILYIGNYLPQDHPYLKMNSKELLKTFDPFLKKINPDYQKDLISSHLFFSPFAQPIVDLSYTKHLPAQTSGSQAFQTPLKNIYIANLSMVYPWDRGTNYAVKMGEDVAEKLNNG